MSVQKEFQGNILIATPNSPEAMTFFNVITDALRERDELSIGDIGFAHTIEDVNRGVESNRYDVLLALDFLGNDVHIGKGSISNWKKTNPFIKIVLIIPSKKRGQRKLESLYNDLNYYDCLYDTEFSDAATHSVKVQPLIDLIVKGRSRDEAYFYYGLDELEKIHEPSLDNTIDNTAAEVKTEPFPSESTPLATPANDDIPYTKPAVEPINVMNEQAGDSFVGSAVTPNISNINKEPSEDTYTQGDVSSYEEPEKVTEHSFFSPSDNKKNIINKELDYDTPLTENTGLSSLMPQYAGYVAKVQTIINDNMLILEIPTGGLEPLRDKLMNKGVIILTK